MKNLSDLNYRKVNTITIEQFAYKGNQDVTIEHTSSTNNIKGKWTYYGVSIHVTPPKFDSLEALIEYLESK